MFGGTFRLANDHKGADKLSSLSSNHDSSHFGYRRHCFDTIPLLVLIIDEDRAFFGGSADHIMVY